MSFAALKWMPMDASDLIDKEGDIQGDVRFGLEEMHGNYEIVGGQIVFKEPVAKHGEQAKSSTVKAKKKNKDAKTFSSVADKDSETKMAKPSKKRKLQPSHDKESATTVGEAKALSSVSVQVDQIVDEDISVDMPEWEVYNLHPYLLKGLEALGFTTPTPIQSLCIPAVLVQGKDVLGAAETGSGKTLAYGLSILSFLLNNPPNKDDGLPALIVTPTRELALQVTQHLRNALVKTPLESRPRIESIVGGMAEVKQERLLTRRPEIVVATMGRLQAWIGRHSYLSKLRESLRFLVVDEADRMTDKAHYADILPLVDLLGGEDGEGELAHATKRNKKRQTLLFSATLLNAEDEKKKRPGQDVRKKKKPRPVGPFALMENLGMRGKPLICNVSSKIQGSEAVEIIKAVDVSLHDEKEKGKKARGKDEKAANSDSAKPKENEDGVVSEVKLPESISFFRIDCTEEDKEAFLHWILSTVNPGSATLVFVNTIAATKRLAMTISLSFPGMSVSSLHANMEQKQRLRNLDKFKEKPASGGKSRVMIASDVAARGLDIPDVDTVIHFGVPLRLDTFIHRSGRCARAGRSGTVVTLATGFEVKLMGKIRSAITPRKMEPYPTKELELKKIFARVRVCKQLAKLQTELKIDQQDRSWKKRTANEADIELDSDFDEGDEDDTKASLKRTMARKERNQVMEQMQYDVAKLKRELAYMLSGRAEAATNGGQHRAGRKRMKV
jgi:ATP-dependent RNA helicase DDX24/MAK5